MSAGGPGFPGRLALLLALLLVLLLAGLLLGTRHVALPWVVLGPSMEPTLSPGDRVVVDVWTYRHRAPRPGEIVLVAGGAPPRQLPMVKRAAKPPASVGSDDGVWILGDNPEASLDSRSFGAVPRERIVGRVLLRYWPLSRAGRIPAAPEASGLRLPVR